MRKKHSTFIGKTINNIFIKDLAPNYNFLIVCPFCKKTGVVDSHNLLSGKLKSCGCQKYIRPKGLFHGLSENLIGKKFGELSVIEIDNERTNRVHWICECKCGNKKSIVARNLKNGSVKTCGGSVHRIGEKSPTWKGVGDLSQRQWGRIIKGAKMRAFQVLISKEDAWQLFKKQNGKCNLTGRDISLINYTKGGTASLDRVDSTKGYIDGNIQWVHKDVNMMKMDLDEEYFIKTCLEICIHKNYVNVKTI